MKKALLMLAAGTAIVAAAPATATTIMPGDSGMTFSAFSGGRGTLLASATLPGVTTTFVSTLTEAVYRNTSGTLDFYFQVARTSGGAVSSDEIDGFDVSSYGGYTVDAQSDGTAFGPFVAANNPALANGTPSGSTTTVGRSVSGNIMRVLFGTNGLTGTENSTTYIFRTNATDFSRLGLATIHDSQSANVIAFQPIGAAVPESATWAMMIVGFGAVGGLMRRRKTTVAFAA